MVHTYFSGTAQKYSKPAPSFFGERLNAWLCDVFIISYRNREEPCGSPTPTPPGARSFRVCHTSYPVSVRRPANLNRASSIPHLTKSPSESADTCSSSNLRLCGHLVRGFTPPWLHAMLGTHAANRQRCFFWSAEFVLLCVFFEFHFTVLCELKHGSPSHFPVVAVKIRKVSAESTPESILRFFDNPGTSRFRTLQNFNNFIPVTSIVSKCNSSKSAPYCRNIWRNVFGKFFKRVKCNPGSW